MARLILITAFALSAVSMRAQQVSYAYDANGNRTNRTVVLQTHAAKSMVQQKDTAFLYEHLAQQQLRIYPNPVKEELTIALDAYSTEHQGEFSLYGPNGALLVRRGIAGTVTKVNMASYAKGVYVLHIRLDGKNTSWKVIKE